MLSTLEKLVFVTWVVALASTFLGVFVDFNLFGESAAECEYAANSGKYAGQTAHVTENIFLNIPVHFGTIYIFNHFLSISTNWTNFC